MIYKWWSLDLYLSPSKGVKSHFRPTYFYYAHLGFYIKNLILFNQIKFFKWLIGVFLDEEDFTNEGICPLATKIDTPSQPGRNYWLQHMSYLKYFGIIKCHHSIYHLISYYIHACAHSCSYMLILPLFLCYPTHYLYNFAHILNFLESKKRRIWC